MQPVIDTTPIIETRSDDWVWPFQFLGSNNAPVDLTGCGFEGAAIRWDHGDIPLSVSNGRLVVDVLTGSVTVKVARADNALVPAGVLSRVALPITDSLGVKSTLVIVPIKVVIP